MAVALLGHFRFAEVASSVHFSNFAKSKKALVPIFQLIEIQGRKLFVLPPMFVGTSRSIP